jgi:glyoxylase-like metal-dependent hydrolase (beta-lactamase superfamily II)
MQVGSWNVQTLMEGTWLLDGGSMFGIVPKKLWAGAHPPDEQNRIVMALRCLLIQGQGKKILVDCGIGDRLNEKQQKIYQHRQTPGGMTGCLKQVGVRPGEITDVIASHLHFDHVGGLLTPSADGRLEPTFENATVHLQEECWAWASRPTVWDGGSFFEEDLPIWERRLKLNLLRGDGEIAEQIRVKVTSGHTPGQQIVVVGEGGGQGTAEAVAYCADLIPTASHIRLPFIMAYDHRPLVTLEEKKVLLAQALEENWMLVFDHDPYTPACRLMEEKGRVVAGDAVCLNSVSSRA